MVESNRDKLLKEAEEEAIRQLQEELTRRLKLKTIDQAVLEDIVKKWVVRRAAMMKELMRKQKGWQL